MNHEKSLTVRRPNSKVDERLSCGLRTHNRDIYRESSTKHATKNVHGLHPESCLYHRSGVVVPQRIPRIGQLEREDSIHVTVFLETRHRVQERGGDIKTANGNRPSPSRS